MDIYYKIKSSSLVEEMDKVLKDSLNEFCLSRLEHDRGVWVDSITGKRRAIISSWDDIYNRGIDGYIVNIIVDIIEDGKYKKKDIYTAFEKRVYPCLMKYGCSIYTLKSVFKKAWTCRYVDSGNEKNERTLSVMDYALNQQPVILKIINSNGFLILFVFLFFILSWYIGVLFVGSMSSFVALCAFVVGICAIQKNALIFPLVSMSICIIVCLYHVIFTEHLALMYAKQNLYVGLSFLLWYPVLWINLERLNDKYFESKRYHN